jgi:mono/diheme cytochrome c family protein
MAMTNRVVLSSHPSALTLLIITLVCIVFSSSGWSQDDADQTKHGEYLARAGLCIACHTNYKNNGAELTGGNPITTPFGTIYSTNITPDRETGIGGWSDTEFLRALRKGVGRHGENLFPAFPYTAFTNMTDEDALAIKAFLFSVSPVRRENTPPDMSPPFTWRFLLTAWKWMYFTEGPYRPDHEKPAQWNRGAYLVEGVVHCGECHTPRDAGGGLKKDFYMAGTPDGPEGELAPNITADPKTGLGDWSVEDLVQLLKEGIKPDGDDVQGLMEDVTVHGYKYMTDEDLTAIAVYIRSLPPINNLVE